MQQQFSVQDIEFDAEGCKLRGWLYQPCQQLNQYPALVMTHGYNCIKELYLDKYAEVFAQAGFVVLVYDHRNFGQSDGLIRQEIDPWQQVKDYRQAISFLQTLACVDSAKIGIWGTSYSGGHVLVVAALDKRVKCVVSQVPTISGWQTTLRRIQPSMLAKLQSDFYEDHRARFQGKPAKMVAMITNPKENALASHGSADAWEFFTGSHAKPEDTWRFKNWCNEITLRSLEMYAAYEPGSYIARIAPTPLLMLVADNDVVTPTDLALAAFNQASEVKKLQLFKGGHFSAYVAQFELTAQAACSWFKQHLQ